MKKMIAAAMATLMLLMACWPPAVSADASSIYSDRSVLLCANVRYRDCISGLLAR